MKAGILDGGHDPYGNLPFLIAGGRRVAPPSRHLERVRSLQSQPSLRRDLLAVGAPL